MRKNLKTFTGLIILLLLFFVWQTVFAQTVGVKIGKIPCLSQYLQVLNIGCGAEDTIQGYIIKLFQFAVGIVGIIAVGFIVYGAIEYAVSAGSPDRQRDAKGKIFSALWGIALLLGSVLILQTINPRLTALPEVGGPRACAEGEEPGQDNCIRVCSIGEEPTPRNPCIKKFLVKSIEACQPANITNKPCDPKVIGGDELLQCLQEQSEIFLERTNTCFKSYTKEELLRVAPKNAFGGDWIGAGGGYYFRSQAGNAFCAPFDLRDCKPGDCNFNTSTLPNYPLNNPPFGDRDNKWC